MIIELGHLAVILALALTLVTFAAAVLGAKWDASFVRAGRLSLYITTALLIAGCGTIVYAFINFDFSVLYVAQHSNSQLPIFYRVAALWGGHEGSLLLWATLVSFFGSLVVARHWKTDPDFMPPVLGTFALVQLGFLLLVIFLSSPFERLVPAAAEGRDMNPLLQDVQMVFHPPALFAGYTGFAVPFAFAMAVLLTGRGADRWIFIARKWIIIAWIALTIGIGLGGHWAYRELGWGGYWAWDPVENASFMPWLIGTALLHSVMVQEQRKTFRIWNIGLAIAAFALSILGTFLVRSGIISSVHAFASDPSRGIFLLGFFVGILGISFGMLIARAERLQNAGFTGLGTSRETLFLYNNLFLIVGMLTVMLGTLFPLVMELTVGTKLTVAAPFFNKTFVPLMAVNLLLMALAPMLPWRKFTTANLWRISKWPLIIGLVAVAASAALGVHKLMALGGIFAAFFAATAVLREFAAVVWARARGKVGGIPRGFALMLNTNRRRYGGLVAHLGMAVLTLGFVGSYAYQQETDVVLDRGQRTIVGQYELHYNGFDPVTGPNWNGFASKIDIYRDDHLVTQLAPQKRFYARSDMPTTEPGRFSTLTHELYVTLGDVDMRTGGALMRVYINPYVHLVWTGLIMLVLGGLLGLSHRIRLRRTT